MTVSYIKYFLRYGNKIERTPNLLIFRLNKMKHFYFMNGITARHLHSTLCSDLTDHP